MKAKIISMFLFVFVLSLVSTVMGASRTGDAKLDAAIQKANSDFDEQMKTGNAAGIASAYKDDGVFVGIDGSCVKGKLEIENMYQSRFEKNGFASATKIDSRNVVVDGDLAYESGYGEITYKKEGKEMKGGGRFLTIWQHQPDGSWKIMYNVVLP